MDTHLPINPLTHPKHWVSLCNKSQVRFTTDFNDTTCADCINAELDYTFGTGFGNEIVYVSDQQDERGNPLFI